MTPDRPDGSFTPTPASLEGSPRTTKDPSRKPVCPRTQTTGMDEEHLKATKADDARVRVEMWDHELAGVMKAEEGAALSKAAAAIRTFCLQWWRRRVTSSFFCWLHQRPEYQQVALDDMAYVVEKTQVKTPGIKEKAYRWAHLGRAVYCDWWSERDARLHRDLRAARDVMERSSRASWFEWDDGSTPVHWK